MKTTFDGDPEKLAFFLNQVWCHLDHYALAYPMEVVVMNMVATNLEGEATVWVTRLHDQDVLELGNIDSFLEELRARFKNKSQALQARQRSRI